MKNLFFLTLLSLNLTFSQNILDIDSTTILNQVNATYTASKSSPINHQNISLNEIEIKSIGQEPSLFLSYTPSITAHTDAGHSQGYSYFRLRGIDQTRVNISLDGVPLNDPMDQAFYFSNFADILNSTSQIQIQRGIGTTKNGTASYAGNIELFSPTLSNSQKTTIGLGYGSYNSIRSFVTFNSGIKKNKAIYVRLSQIYSDGFKQHSSNNSKSLFLSSGLFLDNATWKLNILAGNQKNDLAWMPVLESDINCDRTHNANSHYEVDDFSQIIMQLQNTYSINNKNTLKSSIYSTLANGWWNFDLDNYYGFNSTGLNLSQNEINSNLIGFFTNYIWKNNNLKLTTGIHTNTYNNKFTESDANSELIYNQVNRIKNEISAFQKIEYKINKIIFNTDIQARKTVFDYESDFMMFKPINWCFINPKIGISWQTTNKGLAYFNIGKTGREPAKYDMFQGNDVAIYLCETDENFNPINIPDFANELINSTKPEYVTDLELGFRKNYKKGQININYYYLNFHNERVLNGAYGPNGLALTNSVEKSIRTGFELFTELIIKNNLKLINNSSFNHSVIKQQNIEFTPILTPQIIINQELIYSLNNFDFCLSTRYQSQSYMNFENSATLDEYILINARIDYKFKKYLASIFINNLTDNYYFNNGTVNFNGEKSYFVQAPRNFYISLKYDF